MTDKPCVDDDAAFAAIAVHVIPTPVLLTCRNYKDNGLFMSKEYQTGICNPRFLKDAPSAWVDMPNMNWEFFQDFMQKRTKL